MTELKAKYTLESAQDFLNAYVKHDFGPDVGYGYVYIPKIRWWQFWKWHITFREDYVLSRAGEVIITRRCAAELRRQVDAKVRRTDP